MRVKSFAVKLTKALSFAVIFMSGVANAETLRIGGTGVALGSISLVGAAFEARNPDVSVDVLPSLGSSGGIKALVAGAIDLSVSSRALKPAEAEKGAQAERYATTPLAIVTSSKTNAEAVTTEQLAQMYSGELAHWPSGQLVRVVLRPVSETDTRILSSLSGAVSQAIKAAQERPGLISAMNDQENAETLENLEGSLGAVALGQIATEKRQLKVLRLNGVLPKPGDPSAQAVVFRRDLYIVKTQATSGTAARFYDFLFSDEAASILAAHDHTPVN